MNMITKEQAINKIISTLDKKGIYAETNYDKTEISVPLSQLGLTGLYAVINEDEIESFIENS
jgi:hypothetical protein